MHLKGDTCVTSTMRAGGGGWRLRQKWDVIERKGWGVSKCVLDIQSLFFFIKKMDYAVTRHHAEPSVYILVTRSLPFNSDVRQWSHLLMIPLHCLWAKSNNGRRDQFECDVTWFYFCFNFVRSHARSVRKKRVRLKLYVHGQEGEKISDLDGQAGEESWKLDNFHGRHMCIIPYCYCLKSFA